MIRAVKRTDIKTVRQLLEADLTGELATIANSSERTLIDLAICSGKRTAKAQVPLIKLLREWGARFSLTKHKEYSSVYRDIVNTIKFQSTVK